MKKTYLIPAIETLVLETEGMMLPGSLTANNEQNVRLNAGEEGDILTNQYEGESIWN